MSVGDVEAVVGEVEGVHVADREPDAVRGRFGRRLLRGSDGGRRAVDAFTQPALSRVARSRVMVPGPTPTSSNRSVGRSLANR